MSKNKIVNIHRDDPPEWFKKSDFGIFIHWGLATVPSFAPVEVPDTGESLHDPSKYEELAKNNPYVLWYANSIKIDGSPAQKYHQENFGNMKYEDFADEFKKRAKNADVDEWMELCAKTGAKYVVFVTKHHDGFVMYDTKVKNPRKKDYHLDFDFVGNLAKACRKQGMKFGVYYSSLLDWTFAHKPITSITSLMLENDNSRQYMDYCYNHWMELIDRYKPDVLWSDIGYPADKRLASLLEYYYKQVPEGVVNDRWLQLPNIFRNPIAKYILQKQMDKKMKDGTGHEPSAPEFYDYRTIEYTSEWNKKDVYFEMCRGMDKSFAYNQFSRPEDYITASQVKEIVAEIVPKKGRMLLNMGPDSYGNIPEYQKKILKELEGAFTDKR